MNETKVVVTIRVREDCPPDAQKRIVKVFADGCTELLGFVTDGMDGLVEAEVSIDPD